MLTLLLAAAAAGPPAPGPVEHLHEVVIEAIRNCPKPIEGEVVVCAADVGGAPPYRLPRLDPRYAPKDAPRGPGRLPDVGRTGAGSCSNVGAAGGSGCALGAIRGWSDGRRDERHDDASGGW